MNSYAIFGVSDWAARIPAAFHATAVVFGIFFFMRRFRFASELDAADDRRVFRRHDRIWSRRIN